MKRVLVVYFSQSGQLRDIVNSTIAPLQSAADVEVSVEVLQPVKTFPFPWPFWQFLNTFPETVYEDGPDNLPVSISAKDQFDLIIIAYQVWFLSPSLPTSAFLSSPKAKAALAGKRVITLIGCRNMWLMAQERMKERLTELGAKLIDNVVLTDSAHSALTFVSTPLWVLTGNRGPFLGGLIPAAGVPQDHIKACDRFGHAIVGRLTGPDADNDSPIFAGLGAVQINERLIASEKVGRRSFRIWGKLLRSVGPPESLPRKFLLGFYLVFLLTVILTIVPITALLKRLISSFTQKKIREQRAYFSAPSGEETFALAGKR